MKKIHNFTPSTKLQTVAYSSVMKYELESEIQSKYLIWLLRCKTQSGSSLEGTGPKIYEARINQSISFVSL